MTDLGFPDPGQVTTKVATAVPESVPLPAELRVPADDDAPGRADTAGAPTARPSAQRLPDADVEAWPDPGQDSTARTAPRR